MLHMASALSPRMTFFGEITFTPRTDAGTGTPPATGFNAEVERVIIRFDQSDRPEGVVRPVSHADQLLEHRVSSRPVAADDDQPAGDGAVRRTIHPGPLRRRAGGRRRCRRGGWNINYQAGIGNGRGNVISRAGDAGDNNDFRRASATCSPSPTASSVFRSAASAYSDRITLPSARPDYNERIVAGHAAWQHEDPEIIAEIADVRHQQVGTSLTTSSLGVLRAGRVSTAGADPALEAVLPLRAHRHRPERRRVHRRAESRRLDRRRALRHLDVRLRSRAEGRIRRASTDQPRDERLVLSDRVHVLMVMASPSPQNRVPDAVGRRWRGRSRWAPRPATTSRWSCTRTSRSTACQPPTCAGSCSGIGDSGRAACA